MTLSPATLAQNAAADPDASTWLAANAGSGKTRVLTDRVARLLLRGVLPERILCLTFTKAAASEMQNRLFARLGGWAMLDDATLRKALADLGETVADDAALRQARTLFARAIEAPGGLKIQTIHAFCASVLRRFPLEAGVSPQFRELDDREAQRLRGDIIDRLCEGPDAALVTGVATAMNADQDGFLTRIASLADAFAAPPDRAAIARGYGIDPDLTDADIAARVVTTQARALVSAAASELATGTAVTDTKAATALNALPQDDSAALAVLSKLFLTQDGRISSKAAPTKKLAQSAEFAPLAADFEALKEAVRDARDQSAALDALDRDVALHRFGHAFVQRYHAAKQARGVLDFDDLITRTRDLLAAPGVAEWVLWRLDGGIDHILVDEAQDTSPTQWRVIALLADEITAGLGAHADRLRTLFVVGDKKQSIYAFQGADATGFDRMREAFAERLEQAEQPLQDRVLSFSFRSAQPILDAVDATFEGRAASGFAAAEGHTAFKTRLPGRVDLWPAIAPADDPDDGVWYQPVDRVGERHHTVLLARRIARFIRQSIDDGLPIPSEDDGVVTTRPVQAGDFLILARGRQRLFAEIIRAAKQEGLPIAGADRLRVMAELAVRDILALLRFLDITDDDLSLAIALRSPLFGLSEAALYALANPREGTLWESLRRNKADFPETVALIQDLLGRTDVLRPYELIERILTRHDGRRRLIARLGTEAEDGIDALLAQALVYEAGAVPSLTGFLEWAQTDDLKIKRPADASGKMLRVMTVHGAKGLEAPIVILPDCAEQRAHGTPNVLDDGHGAMWKGSGKGLPARQRAAQDAATEAEAAERDRLLYVAMTRAEKWLIVAAAGKTGTEKPCWYDQVQDGMQRAGAAPHAFDFGHGDTGDGLTLKSADWGVARGSAPTPPMSAAPPSLPGYLSHPAPPPPARMKTREPSDLGGAKALPGAAGDETEIAKIRGSLVHLLLEALAPLAPDARVAAAPRYRDLALKDPALAPLGDQSDALVAEALETLAAPPLAPLFGPNSLAEVPVSATLPGLGRIHGIVDRLVIGSDTVLVADFKTNRTIPATPDHVPEALLRQMGAYAAALAQIYPGRSIQTALVWTAGPARMDLPHDTVTAALARATAS